MVTTPSTSNERIHDRFAESWTDGSKLADRCACCVMPRSARGLRFDRRGVCSLCNAYQELRQRGGDVEEQPANIEAVLEEIRKRGRNREFDCVVGLSGGRDSSYLLHQLVRVHRLRCLAAYYRTPFTHDVIEENVQRVVHLLDVPLVRMNISQEAHRQVARKVLLMWKQAPCLELVNMLCCVCKYVNRELFRVARDHGIKACVTGGNKYEEFQLGLTYAAPKAGQHIHGLATQVRQTAMIVKRGLEFLARHPRVIPLTLIGFKAASLYVSPHSPYLRIRYPDIKRIDYFRHVNYDEAKCTQLVTSELGWRLPPDCNSYWRADCAMDDVKNVLFRYTVGTSYRDSYFSNMVRFGAVTRAEALRRLETEGRISPQRVMQVAQTLGVELGVPEG